MSVAPKISKEERIFCELFVNGCAPYAGNAAKCYADVFHTSKEDEMFNNQKAAVLLQEPRIAEYVKELEALSIEDAKNMKRFLTANLKHIIEETSRDIYYDRRGKALSPAALRSVAVSASKALMEMYPVKESQVNKFEINGGGESGITFNVIVPEQKSQTDTPNETE